METNKEKGADFPLSQRTNILIQLVAFIIIVLMAIYVEHTNLGNFPLERLFKCSAFMIIATIVQCALFSLKGGKFVLLWIGIFILTIFVKRNNLVHYNCLVTVDKIVPYRGGKVSSSVGIYVNVCGCPDREIKVQCDKFFKDMNNIKKGDTLLATIRLYPDGVLPGGISDLTTKLIKDYSPKEKKEYTPPSYWYYSFFPNCLNNYGCNIVYKALKMKECLEFTNIYGKTQRIPLSDNDVDSVLVYKNINPELGIQYEICKPEINTPENWAKITDYGYLFESDIYSKEEVERECPGVKTYVEKLKKRHQAP